MESGEAVAVYVYVRIIDERDFVEWVCFDVIQAFDDGVDFGFLDSCGVSEGGDIVGGSFVDFVALEEPTICGFAWVGIAGAVGIIIYCYFGDLGLLGWFGGDGIVCWNLEDVISRQCGDWISCDFVVGGYG